MVDKNDKPTFKLIVTGDSGVGKSCLIQVYSAIVNHTKETFADIIENPGATVGKFFHFWLRPLTYNTFNRL